MKPCERWRESLIDMRYGLLEGSGERECRQHVSVCAACAAELESLQRLCASLAPEPEDAYGREAEVDWDRFARTTVRRAIEASKAEDAALTRREPASRIELFAGKLTAWLESLRLPVAPVWAAAAAGLIVVVALGLMTYNFFPTLPGTTSPVSTTASATSVLVPQQNLDNLTVNLARRNTAEYLKETRAVLVSMLDVNIECDKEKVDISAERAKASELLRRQRLIAAELGRMPLARAQDVCNDLEKLLLEVASLADCARGDDIRTIRDLVEKRQILVRMELLSQELARREASRA